MIEIIVACIAGIASVIGVVLTNRAANQKIVAKLDTAQSVTDTKIEELTREVREHNNFARRVPVLENQIQDISRRLGNVEK